MVHVELVGKENEQKLSNLLQKYLYEMTQYYENDLDEEGNYSYKYLPYYFVEENRQAFFIYDDEELIGFSLINTHSFTKEQVDSCIAEFTIFPRFRKNGNGMKAIEALCERRPGTWQLKYSIQNETGMKFWKKVQKKYDGIETHLEEFEYAITFNSCSK